MTCNDLHDLEVLVRGTTPLVAISTTEEKRVERIAVRMALRLARPAFRWTITDGLQRLDIEQPVGLADEEPETLLRYLKQSRDSGIFLLADFHPYLDEALNVRLLKDIALAAGHDRNLLLVSHVVQLPPELAALGAQFELSLPDDAVLEAAVREAAKVYVEQNPGARIVSDRAALARIVANLRGLSLPEARRLAMHAIANDGALTDADLPALQREKFDVLNREGVLYFEPEVADMDAVGGLKNLKAWLAQRAAAFAGEKIIDERDRPRGVLLTGVQGCGKSLAARAVAGSWRLPLLRLDCGALFNKFHGESERNLRESLKTAEAMVPCVLWIDEIEKGIATGGGMDGGTSQRMLATLLTWMSEHRAGVFLVATANDITRLPPELVRKGRFDEVFFVDLPDQATRGTILEIHLRAREVALDAKALASVAEVTDGFSGAELEALVVAARYATASSDAELSAATLLAEAGRTRPLSVLMQEDLQELRNWARERAVTAD